MSGTSFEEHRAADATGLPYYEAGSGETIVAIVTDGSPTKAHALLSEQRRVIVFAIPADAAGPQEAARRIATALAALGVERCDLIGEGSGGAAALWLALAGQPDVGSVVLAAPEGADDEFRGVSRPVLVLCGTKDGSNSADRYRRLLPDCHFMLVYDAGYAIGDERPEALAFIAQEFFARRDLFLVSRESGLALP